MIKTIKGCSCNYRAVCSGYRTEVTCDVCGTSRLAEKCWLGPEGVGMGSALIGKHNKRRIDFCDTHRDREIEEKIQEII